jgi:hypothetical protein
MSAMVPFWKHEDFPFWAWLAGFAAQALMQAHGLWPVVFAFATERIGTVGLIVTGILFAVSAGGIAELQRLSKNGQSRTDTLTTAIAWAFVLIPLAAIALQWIPEIQIAVLGEDPLRDSARITIPELRDQYRNTLMKILGGAVVLAGLFVAWQRTHAALKAVEATERGQVTERFTRAIEHIGAIHGAGTQKERPNIEVRLGGIYALAQIAREAKDTDDNLRMQIVEILAAYLRENATPSAKSQRWITDDSLEKGGFYYDRPREDVQATLNALVGRQCISETSDRLSLWGGYFAGTELGRTNFKSARLAGCSFRDTFLANATLMNTSLHHADLGMAILKGADLRSAVMDWCGLQGADLSDSKLQRASLAHADMTNAKLLNANMQNTDLSSTLGLKREQLQQAKIYKSTKLPPEFADLAENGLDDEE